MKIAPIKKDEPNILETVSSCETYASIDYGLVVKLEFRGINAERVASKLNDLETEWFGKYKYTIPDYNDYNGYNLGVNGYLGTKPEDMYEYGG